MRPIVASGCPGRTSGRCGCRTALAGLPSVVLPYAAMKSRWMKGCLGVVLLVALLMVGVLFQRRLVMGPATGIGLHDGRLAECPPTPNCVSSLAEDEEHKVAPLDLDGEPAAAIARLRTLLEALPRTRVVNASDTYLHAEVTSLIFRYVDDLELAVAADEGKIHMRSASRTGYSDLGVNRKRVQAVAEAYGQSVAD